MNLFEHRMYDILDCCNRTNAYYFIGCDPGVLLSFCDIMNMPDALIISMAEHILLIFAMLQAYEGNFNAHLDTEGRSFWRDLNKNGHGASDRGRCGKAQCVGGEEENGVQAVQLKSEK
ncbi:hypothetical protein T4B_15295 [Trichinella pseudospiralis]|uniref:Uncharacterized protein n=1 Tax=Trichinella pseudospiralis TaxID=6337 RepID=A0A0V1ICU6_TRIPS|nr:hypothetical protein T4B_15295 [Trichinella pseudospiralis]